MNFIKQKTILKGLIALLTIFSLLSPFTAVLAQQKESRWLTLSAPSLVDIIGFGTWNETKPKDLRVIIAEIILVVLGILGTICVILIVMAGYKWMTSQGNSTKTGDAQKIMTSAVIGLLIILASLGLTVFITRNIVGTTNSNANVPFQTQYQNK